MRKTKHADKHGLVETPIAILPYMHRCLEECTSKMWKCMEEARDDFTLLCDGRSEQTTSTASKTSAPHPQKKRYELIYNNLSWGLFIHSLYLESACGWFLNERMHHIVSEVRYEGKDDDAFQKRISDAWI
jgi:hypothetical protein